MELSLIVFLLILNVEEYSVKEIAEIVKLSETAVQTRPLRARQKLKEALNGAWK